MVLSEQSQMAGKGRNRRPCRNSLWPSPYEPFLDKQVFKIMLYDSNRFRTPILKKKRRTENPFRLPKIKILTEISLIQSGKQV